MVEPRCRRLEGLIESYEEGDLEVLTSTIPFNQIRSFLSNKLRPLLPYSIPLYRRCQYHWRTSPVRPTDSSTTEGNMSPELWVAVAAPRVEKCPSDWLESWLSVPEKTQSDSPPPESFALSYEYNSSAPSMDDWSWLAAHIDLSIPGQTQIWVFGSWEPNLASVSELASKNIETMPLSPVHAAMFQSLYRRLQTNHVPYLPVSPPARWLILRDSGKYCSVPYKRSKILFGTVAQCHWPYFHHDGRDMNLDLKSTPRDRGYIKYIIDLSPGMLAYKLDKARNSSVSSGYRIGALADTHLQMMLDRSKIPRTIELLRELVTVGLFPDGSSTAAVDKSVSEQAQTPIAWGVLSKDASVGSLHTEPDYRGKRLAEKVAWELIKMQDETFNLEYNVRGDAVAGDKIQGGDDAEVPFAHADVATDNVPSQRVFEKMGGHAKWIDGWIELDVGEAPSYGS